jgi:hypothetical protein
MRYLAEYRKLHSEHKFPGRSMLQYVPVIADLIAEYGSKKILDYGCGEGTQWSHERAHNALGIDIPTLYDPAVPEWSQRPIPEDGKFDGVICTDVVEHIPESGNYGNELKAAVEHIASLTGQWAFISVCCRPSKHMRFTDGGNVHCTIHPFEWWQEFMKPHFKYVRLVLVQSP